jgi:glycerol-3-phosphate dehydrogenase
MVPWRGRALFGTWESDAPCSADAVTVIDHEVEAFIADLNVAYPGLNLLRSEVSLVHRGVVPAVRRRRHVKLESRERVRDHAVDGTEGLISVAGTKYTTARATAERIVDMVCTKVNRDGARSRSATTPLPWSNASGDELLVHAARHEMVVTLADAVMRRTPLGALGLPDDQSLHHAAAVVGAELGWSDERQRAEIAALRSLY